MTAARDVTITGIDSVTHHYGGQDKHWVMILGSTVTGGIKPVIGRRAGLRAARADIEFVLAALAERPEWDEHLIALAELVRAQRSREEAGNRQRAAQGRPPLTRQALLSGRQDGRLTFEILRAFGKEKTMPGTPEHADRQRPGQ